MQRFLADDRWYIQESHYQALAVFFVVPLVWDVLPSLGLTTLSRLTNEAAPQEQTQDLTTFKKLSNLLPFILITFLLTIRTIGIWNTHEPYTARLDYVRSILEKTKNLESRKLVVGYEDVDRKTLMMYWGLPFETLQMSALQSPDSLRVIAIAGNSDSLATRLSRDSMPEFLMIRGKAFRDLPERYYRMGDSSGWRVVRLQ
jgi:hypothetical protein